MSSKPLLALGIVGLVFALLIGFNVVALAGSVTCVTGCNNTLGVAVNFNYTANGTAIVVTDQSTSPNPNGPGAKAIIENVTIGWGDGKAPAMIHKGQSYQHIYAGSGSYNITDTLGVQFCTGGVGPGGERCTNFEVVGYEVVKITNGGGHGTGGCGSGCPQISLTPSFTYTLNGYKAHLTDTSTASSGAKVTGLTISWGDGGGGSSSRLGAQFNHTYAAKGNFTVLDAVSWTDNGTPMLSTYNQTLDVCSTCNSSDQNNTIAALFVFHPSFLTGFIALGSLATLAVAFVPLRTPSLQGIMALIIFAVGIAGGVALFALGAGAIV
jgi:hypothetical protein